MMQTIRFYILIILFVSMGTVSQAQKINWTSFETLSGKMRAAPKPVLIFIHTDWCKYCAMQDKNTFSNGKIAATLNRDFYCVRLNAESKEDIVFMNRTYRYQASGAGTGHHQLAAFLGKEAGKLSFPTTLMLSPSFELINRKVGIVDAATMELLMQADPQP